MIALSFALVALALPTLLASGYLLLLTVLSRRPAPPPPGAHLRRFDVVVPAHDEERCIARTVASLRAVDWPADRFRVTVVADNCTDRTAELAAGAGAAVLVRTNPDQRGKGYALEFAFERVLADGFADAAVVVDADTEVSAGLLAAMALRLDAGADAVQVRYGVLNRDASWRTRLIALAFTLFHDVRSLGRERLRVSCGLRGNGMCFSRRALERVPHRAFSLVEDLEYGIRLGQAGIRVHYADEAVVRGEMVAGEAASRSQRRRWEGGRMAMMRQQGLPLLAEALRRGDRVLLDLAFDVLVPPLSWIGASALAGTILAAALSWAGLTAPWTALPWLAGLAFLAAHVTRGVQLSGMGLAGVAALAWAPVYLAWKVLLLARPARNRPSEWVRTSRDPKGNSPSKPL